MSDLPTCYLAMTAAATAIAARFGIDDEAARGVDWRVFPVPGDRIVLKGTEGVVPFVVLCRSHRPDNDSVEIVIDPVPGFDYGAEAPLEDS